MEVSQALQQKLTENGCTIKELPNGKLALMYGETPLKVAKTLKTLEKHLDKYPRLQFS